MQKGNRPLNQLLATPETLDGAVEVSTAEALTLLRAGAQTRGGEDSRVLGRIQRYRLNGKLFAWVGTSSEEYPTNLGNRTA